MATEAMSGQPKQTNPQQSKSKGMDILSSAVGGAGSLISAVGGLITRNSDRKFQQRLMREQNNFNAQEAEKSYQRQVEMFNMQNQYNSPANQRQLYQAAGFNPNLAMSGSAGTAAATGASSAPQASSGTAPDVRSQNPMAALGDFAGIVSSLSQSKLNESLANKADSEAENNSVNTKYQTMVNEIYSKYGEKDFLSQISNRDYQTAVYDSQQQVNDWVSKLHKDELSNLRPKQLANMVADYQLKVIEAELRNAEVAESKARRAEILLSIPYKLGMFAATTRELNSRARHNNAQASLIEPGGALNYLYQQQGRKAFWEADSAQYQSENDFMDWSVKDDVYKDYYEEIVEELVAGLKTSVHKGQVDESIMEEFNDSGWIGKTLRIIKGITDLGGNVFSGSGAAFVGGAMRPKPLPKP